MFGYNIGTEGTAVVTTCKMAVGAGVWGGLLVGVGVVPDDVAGGVVAGPATSIYTVCAGIAIVHTGMDALAVVFAVDIAETGVVVLVTAVVAAQTARTAAANNLDIMEVCGLGAVNCVALVATAVLGGGIEVTEHVSVVDLESIAPAGTIGGVALVVTEETIGGVGHTVNCLGPVGNVTIHGGNVIDETIVTGSIGGVVLGVAVAGSSIGTVVVAVTTGGVTCCATL